MKTILALCVLMIGLLVMPPGPVQASDLPTGSCFVLHVDFAPAGFVQEVATATVMQNFVSSICFSANVINLPVISYCTEKLVIMKLPVVNLFYVDRLCQQTFAANLRPPKLQRSKALNNIASANRPRADTSI